jgi:hypothetical protein
MNTNVNIDSRFTNLDTILADFGMISLESPLEITPSIHRVNITALNNSLTINAPELNTISVLDINPVGTQNLTWNDISGALIPLPSQISARTVFVFVYGTSWTLVNLEEFQ